MQNLRENRFFLLIAYADGIMNVQEYALLYNINKSRNLDLSYWQYDKFDLDQMCNNECKSEFYVLEIDIYRLCETLRFPENIIYVKVSDFLSLTTFYMLLKQYVYLCCYLNIIQCLELSISMKR